MDFLNRADRLRQEAGLILQEIKLNEILVPYGTMNFTGSYYLDLMAYPDMDVEVSQMTTGQIFSVLSQFFEHPWLDQVEFEKPNEPRLPGSLYFKLRIVHGDWGRPWKIDIWSLSHSQLASGRKEMQRNYIALQSCPFERPGSHASRQRLVDIQSCFGGWIGRPTGDRRLSNC